MKTYSIQGRTLPSVTTILEATQGELAASQLGRWYAEGGCSAVVSNRRSIERGNQVDAWVKQCANSASNPTALLTEIDQQYWPIARRLIPFLSNLPKGAETDLLVDTDCYAGTADLVLPTGAGGLVVELKTRSSRALPEMVNRAKLQAVAYRTALAWRTAAAPAVLVLVVSPYGLEEFRVQTGELEQLTELWNLRLSAFYGGKL